MKKEIIIVTIFIIIGIALFYFNSNNLTGQVILEYRQDDLINYTLQTLDIMQSRLEISITTKNFDKDKFNLESFLVDTQEDLTKARLLKQKLININPPKGYEEVHLSMIKSMDYLINALELAIEGSAQSNQDKIYLAIDYIKKSNQEFDRASGLIRNI